MHYVLVYDVSDDDTRDKIRELLKDYGAKRIQYSAFEADLEEPTLIELLQRAKRLLRGSDGALIAIPLCSRDLEKTVTIGEEKDEESVF